MSVKTVNIVKIHHELNSLFGKDIAEEIFNHIYCNRAIFIQQFWRFYRKMNKCPSYFQVGWWEWSRKKLELFGYGKRKLYNIGDKVLYGGFAFRDDRSYKRDNYFVHHCVVIRYDTRHNFYELNYYDQFFKHQLGGCCGVSTDSMKPIPKITRVNRN